MPAVTTHHTFVLPLLTSQATMQDSQKRQGLRAWLPQKTYADQLQQAENSYAEQIVTLFGLSSWGMCTFSCPVNEAA
jgi:hypothetical protein